jgi:hypothetical protein
MSNARPTRDAQFTILGLMLLVAASALVALGIRFFRAALVAGLPENYSGDSNSQDFEVLEQAIPALALILLAGSICGFAAGKSRVDRVRLLMRGLRKPVTLASAPILLAASLVPIPTAAKQAAWGAVFFGLPALNIGGRRPVAADAVPTRDNTSVLGVIR